MDLTELLASLLNPGGQQAILGAPNAATAVGDHNNPAILQAQMAQFQRPPQMQQPMQAPRQAPQQQQVAQAPQQPPMQPNAPQGAPAPQGGGLGGLLSNLINPQNAGKTRTVGWLQEQGLDEGTATVLASDKGALRSYMLQRAKGGGATEFDQRAAAAKQYGLVEGSPEFREYTLTGNLPSARGGADELGLNLVYAKGPDGKLAAFQPSKGGGLKAAGLPSGYTLEPGVGRIDLGSEWGITDRSGTVIQRIPKDLAGEASQKAIGAAQGAAAFDLPRVEQNAQQTLDVIEQLKNHPGRGTATGLSATLDPRNYLAGTDATNFKIALDQAKGQTFLQAFQSLKGGGQITEIEGAKATDAIARLNTAQSDEEFTKALGDFESVIRTGLDRAKKQAGTVAGGNDRPAFSDNKAVFDAISTGKLKIGDEIIVNGKRMRVDP